MGHPEDLYYIGHKMPTMTVKPNKLYLSLSRSSACLIPSYCSQSFSWNISVHGVCKTIAFFLIVHNVALF